MSRVTRRPRPARNFVATDTSNQSSGSAAVTRGGGHACHPGAVTTVYEAVSGSDGLLSLAGAWHARVLADEVVRSWDGLITGTGPEDT